MQKNSCVKVVIGQMVILSCRGEFSSTKTHKRRICQIIFIEIQFASEPSLQPSSYREFELLGDGKCLEN